MFSEFCTAHGGLRNLFLQKLVSSQNLGFYENLMLQKFGAIQYGIIVFPQTVVRQLSNSIQHVAILL